MIQNQRGAITIHVALSLMATLMFAGWVIDGGVWNVARTQAQGAADAGALAAAIEARDNPLGVANAQAAGRSIANLNAVWGQAVGDANVAVSNFPIDCFPGSPKNRKTCIQVDVYRGLNRAGAAQGTPMNTFLVRLVGPSTQPVRATAMAEVAAGNTTSCMRPWMISDKFVNNAGGPNYDPGDVYIPPTPANGDTTTGYTLKNDYGTILTLKEGDPKGAISPSDYYEIDDASVYEEHIVGCGLTGTIGGTQVTLPGNRVGPTKQATGELIQQDPLARWNGSAVVDSAFEVSPRVVPIAMFSPVEFASRDRTSGRFDLTVVNIMGFFIISVDNNSTVTGVICAAPSLKLSGAGSVSEDAAFLKVIRLVK